MAFSIIFGTRLFPFAGLLDFKVVQTSPNPQTEYDKGGAPSSAPLRCSLSNLRRKSGHSKQEIYVDQHQIE